MFWSNRFHQLYINLVAFCLQFLQRWEYQDTMLRSSAVLFLLHALVVNLRSPITSLKYQQTKCNKHITWNQFNKRNKCLVIFNLAMKRNKIVVLDLKILWQFVWGPKYHVYKITRLSPNKFWYMYCFNSSLIWRDLYFFFSLLILSIGGNKI